MRSIENPPGQSACPLHPADERPAWLSPLRHAPSSWNGPHRRQGRVDPPPAKAAATSWTIKTGEAR